MGEKKYIFHDLYPLAGDILSGTKNITSYPWLDHKDQIKKYEEKRYADILKGIDLGMNNAGVSRSSLIQPIQTRRLTPPSPPRLVRTRKISSHQYNKKPKLLRTEPACPYWKENGWKKANRTYYGYYKTRYGSYEGSIKENFLNNCAYFIFDPPERVLNGDHGACFGYKGDGAYSIHFSQNPKNISEGIITVEMLIAESVNGF